jgi:hypothetical protein
VLKPSRCFGVNTPVPTADEPANAVTVAPR